MANTQRVTQESIELESTIRKRDVKQLQTKGSTLMAPAENLSVSDETELEKFDRLWIVYVWGPNDNGSCYNHFQSYSEKEARAHYPNTTDWTRVLWHNNKEVDYGSDDTFTCVNLARIEREGAKRRDNT